MSALSQLDVVVVLTYLLSMTALGVWCARRQRTLRTYFVGDRNVAWWLILISIVTTETSAVTFLSVPGLSYAPGGDMTFLQLAFGYVVGRLLIAAPGDMLVRAHQHELVAIELRCLARSHVENGKRYAALRGRRHNAGNMRRGVEAE